MNDTMNMPRQNTTRPFIQHDTTYALENAPLNMTIIIIHVRLLTIITYKVEMLTHSEIM
jgi:hypothetical protein